MANRMDIELTSARDDVFTWRAAGARQPRGSVASSLLPPSSKVGDVLRAEVEVEIDGITVVSILPPKEKAAPSDRIEHIGPSRPSPGVTTVLARGERRGRDSRRRDSRREGRDDGRGTEGRRTEGRRTEGRRPAREAGRPRDSEASRQASRREAPARRGPARFEPGTAHRDELFATLTPEQQPIAERLAVGGLPAVRKALAEEQERAKSEGRPVVSGEPIVALAEQLLPDVRAAVWLDRAEAAAPRAEEIPLRDLRAAVVGASPRDEAGKALERQLKEALERRVTKLRADWEAHIGQAMEDGRVLQALRLSAKPPEPTARFPGALAGRLAELAGNAMTEETPPERWLALLQAATESPVRRQVRPAGMPKDPSGEVERQARMAASRIPALARLLGMPIPPPPRPGAPGQRSPARPARRSGAGGKRRPTPSSSSPSAPPEVEPPAAVQSAETEPAAPEAETEPGAAAQGAEAVPTAPEAPPAPEAPARLDAPDTVEEAEVAEETPDGNLGGEEGAVGETASEPVAGEEFGQPFDEAESS